MSTKKNSLLTKEEIEKLESFAGDSSGYFWKMLNYLKDIIDQGIEEKRFTKEEAKADLEIALWYSYACNNIDDYEHYYMAMDWMKDSEKKR